jgi:glycosyltransferase involved in cell wall biosynthesis
MTHPRVSIVIPTLNAGPALDDVLAAIARQDGEFRPEIVAIDSGSTDNTLTRLRETGATVLSVPDGTFNHGETRNQALAHADGEFAVLLVQDAVPVSPGWLCALLDPLVRDPSVAGTFARQVPSARASRVTAHYLAQWVAAQSRPRTSGPLTPDAFAHMTPAERHATCAFDNVCSCVRLSVWRDHPFRPTAIAEDLEWARDVLLAGHKLTYVPEAVVQHSHERPVSYELQRTYLVHQRLEALFGLATVPTMMSLIRSVATTIPVNARVASREPYRRTRAVLRGAALGIALPLGQYLGARAAREGREFLRTRGV